MFKKNNPFTTNIFDLPLVSLPNINNHEVADICSIELIKQYRIIPLKKSDGLLQIGMVDPTDQSAIDAVIFHTGMRVSLAIVREAEFYDFIEKHYDGIKNINWNESNPETPTVQEAVVNYDEPLIKLTNDIIQHAIKKSASDIHIEPYEKQCRVRFRQQGILQEITEISNSVATRLITRLKVISKLDIAERRLPQDGHFQFDRIDIRINTCPTLFGEKIVLRLLNPNNVILDIDKLGFSLSQKKYFLEKISEPQGMILVAGPTGSGKTTTLYSALQHLNTPTKNISTAEDPIEIQLRGINQVNINPKIGLHFSTLLRTFLRQDPDVIMIGEIRDAETAEIAFQAAQTGHLVLSTIHANNTIEAVNRLKFLGIQEANLSSVSLIISQRLLRMLCPHCKTPHLMDLKMKNQLNVPEHAILFQSQGCNRCQNGYQGRMGIFEFLSLDPGNPKTFLNLQAVARKQIFSGLTSLAEVKRVL